jgi:hypothetical protein
LYGQLYEQAPAAARKVQLTVVQVLLGSSILILGAGHAALGMYMAM